MPRHYQFFVATTTKKVSFQIRDEEDEEEVRKPRIRKSSFGKHYIFVKCLRSGRVWCYETSTKMKEKWSDSRDRTECLGQKKPSRLKKGDLVRELARLLKNDETLPVEDEEWEGSPGEIFAIKLYESVFTEVYEEGDARLERWQEMVKGSSGTEAVAVSEKFNKLTRHKL